MEQAVNYIPYILEKILPHLQVSWSAVKELMDAEILIVVALSAGHAVVIQQSKGKISTEGFANSFEVSTSEMKYF